ncbi:MAG: Free methionine-(R)-sulfoxide reductase, contains GAF domain, partial [uncultured Rubrobacteraceae bacterium]
GRSHGAGEGPSGGGGGARCLGRPGRRGAGSGGAAGTRRAPVLGLERHLFDEGRSARARAQHRAGGPRPDRGRGGRLRDGRGRGQKPGRRGRARGRELPGLLHPHPLGDRRPDPARRADRRPVRHRLRYSRRVYRRRRGVARRARRGRRPSRRLAGRFL